jgi:hypothetical protein
MEGQKATQQGLKGWFENGLRQAFAADEPPFNGEHGDE